MGYFVHCKMCLRGNFNILVYEGDKMRNKNIPLLCPGVREVFLPSIVLSNKQPQPKTHSLHTVHAQQINTHLSLQAAKARWRFAWKQCQWFADSKMLNVPCADTVPEPNPQPSAFMLWGGTAAPRCSQSVTCWILNAAWTKILIEKQPAESRFCFQASWSNFFCCFFNVFFSLFSYRPLPWAQGHEGQLKPLPAVAGRRQGVTLNKPPVHRSATKRQTTKHTLTHTPTDNSVSNSPHMHFLDCGRKLWKT